MVKLNDYYNYIIIIILLSNTGVSMKYFWYFLLKISLVDMQDEFVNDMYNINNNYRYNSFIYFINFILFIDRYIWCIFTFIS